MRGHGLFSWICSLSFFFPEVVLPNLIKLSPENLTTDPKVRQCFLHGWSWWLKPILKKHQMCVCVCTYIHLVLFYRDLTRVCLGPPLGSCLEGTSLYFWEIYIPYIPCMVYLPTFTIKINQMCIIWPDTYRMGIRSWEDLFFNTLSQQPPAPSTDSLKK